MTRVKGRVEEIPLVEMGADDGLDDRIEQQDVVNQALAGFVFWRQRDRREREGFEMRPFLAQDIARADCRLRQPGKPHDDREIAFEMRRTVEEGAADLAGKTLVAEHRNRTAFLQYLQCRPYPLLARRHKAVSQLAPDPLGDPGPRPSGGRRIVGGWAQSEFNELRGIYLPVSEMHADHDHRPLRMGLGEIVEIVPDDASRQKPDDR